MLKISSPSADWMTCELMMMPRASTPICRKARTVTLVCEAMLSGKCKTRMSYRVVLRNAMNFSIIDGEVAGDMLIGRDVSSHQ